MAGPTDEFLRRFERREETAKSGEGEAGGNNRSTSLEVQPDSAGLSRTRSHVTARMNLTDRYLNGISQSCERPRESYA